MAAVGSAQIVYHGSTYAPRISQAVMAAVTPAAGSLIRPAAQPGGRDQDQYHDEGEWDEQRRCRPRAYGKKRGSKRKGTFQIEARVITAVFAWASEVVIPGVRSMTGSATRNGAAANAPTPRHRARVQVQTASGRSARPAVAFTRIAAAIQQPACANRSFRWLDDGEE